MIRTLLALIPDRPRAARSRAYAALTVVSVLLRAAGTVLLVPLVAALFGDDTGRRVGLAGLADGGDGRSAGSSTPSRRASVSTSASPCSTARNTTWPTGCPNIRLDWLDE